MEKEHDSGAYTGYEEEIIKIIQEDNSTKQIQAKLAIYHANDLARAINRLDDGGRRKIYHFCSSEMLAKAFKHISTEKAATYINEMGVLKASHILSELEAGIAVDLLCEVDDEKRKLLLDSIPSEVQSDIQYVTSFEDEEIGSRMAMDYISVSKELTVGQAIEQWMIQTAEGKEASTIFLLDEEEHFYGGISIKKLLQKDHDIPLTDLYTQTFPIVHAKETIDGCIDDLQEYAEEYIPVLDEEQRICGIITAKTIMETLDRNKTSKQTAFAALTRTENDLSTTKSSLKARIPWLSVLFFLGIASSILTGGFEATASTLPLLIPFQFFIAGLAGNAGIQALQTTLHIMSDKTLRHSPKRFGKELKNGLCTGFLLGLCCFALVGLYFVWAKHQTWATAYALSGCIGLSLMLSMTFAMILGAILPGFFKKISTDATDASAPLIAVLSDLVSILIYWCIAWCILT